MGKDDLTELIAIWEYWTNGDPLLREAVQECAGAATRRHDAAAAHILDRLIALVNLEYADAVTVAALSAGWAVLLALEHPQYAESPQWQRLRREALHDHREALAEWPHGGHAGPRAHGTPGGP
jgi:hypothetical protein